MLLDKENYGVMLILTHRVYNSTKKKYIFIADLIFIIFILDNDVNTQLAYFIILLHPQNNLYYNKMLIMNFYLAF